jgi:cell filamentation protein, protein adenylyltransferase
VSDPYLIPGTNVLRNKFNILDVDELDRRINDVAIAEAAVLFYVGTPVKPSMPGWQTVHKALFGAVFDWAGEFRTLHIRKIDETGRQDGLFASYERIATEGKKAMVISKLRCGGPLPRTWFRSLTISRTSIAS